MPHASANGIDTYYEEHGEAAAAVLFIHGGYGGATTSVVPPNSRTSDVIRCTPPDLVRTVTYDRRSAGRSTYVLEPYSQADIANDAVALLDHLGIDRAIIFGHSAGGPIALELALRHPERVRALVLACTGSYLMRPRPRTEILKAQLEELKAKGDRAFFEAHKDGRLYPQAAHPIWHPSVEREMAAHMESVQTALGEAPKEDVFRYSIGEMRNIAAAFEMDCTEQLSEIDVPTLVIHGTADSVVPFAWGEDLHKGITGSDFHAVDAADHGVFTWPEAQQHIRNWMERILASKP